MGGTQNSSLTRLLFLANRLILFGARNQAAPVPEQSGKGGLTLCEVRCGERLLGICFGSGNGGHTFTSAQQQIRGETLIPLSVSSIHRRLCNFIFFFFFLLKQTRSSTDVAGGLLLHHLTSRLFVAPDSKVPTFVMLLLWQSASS